MVQCRPKFLTAISECGSSLPLFLPLTRQRLVMRRDELRRAKAATSRRIPKGAYFGYSPKLKFTSISVNTSTGSELSSVG